MPLWLLAITLLRRAHDISVAIACELLTVPDDQMPRLAEEVMAVIWDGNRPAGVNLQEGLARETSRVNAVAAGSRPKSPTGFGLDRFSTERKPTSSDPEGGQATNLDSGVNTPDVSLSRSDASSVTSDAFSDALRRVISTPTGRGDRPVPAWDPIPGLADIVLHQRKNTTVSAYSFATQPHISDGYAEPTIAVEPAHSVFSDVISNAPASDRELETAEEGAHRSETHCPAPRQRFFLENIVRQSRKLPCPCMPRSLTVDAHGIGSQRLSRLFLLGAMLKRHRCCLSESKDCRCELTQVCRGSFAGMVESPSLEFPSRTHMGDPLGPQTLINPTLPSQFNFGSQLLDQSTGLGGFSQFVGEGNFKAPGSSAVDPAVAGLQFPGQDSFEPTRGSSRARGSNYMQVGAMGSAPSGQFDSLSESNDRGSSLDLSKTNDLLQQLLDEVRKGRQPFLPMNDRNSSF